MFSVSMNKGHEFYEKLKIKYFHIYLPRSGTFSLSKALPLEWVVNVVEIS